MNPKTSVILIYCVTAFLSAPVFSQEVVKTTGSAQIELADNMSRLEVKNRVRELATIDALEKAFGRVVIQGNSTYLTNLQTGQKVETNTVFRMIANTSVKGEVIEVLDERYKDVKGVKIINGKEQQITEIHCEIDIKAREITTPPVNFISFPLACLDEKCRTTAFKDGDSFYLYFMSPVSGYITIYLDDNAIAQCLYPHYYMSAGFDGGVPVEADKKYFLFSDKPEYSYFSKMNIPPVTYEMTTKSIQDLNRLFIIFSPAPLNKPSLKDMSEQFLEKDEFNQGYRLPKSLLSEDFQKWLNSYRSLSKNDVQVEIIDITIAK